MRAVGRAVVRAVGRAPLAGGATGGAARGPQGEVRRRGVVDLGGRGHGAAARQALAQALAGAAAVLAVLAVRPRGVAGGGRAQQQPQPHVQVALRALRRLAAGGRGARQGLDRVVVREGVLRVLRVLRVLLLLGALLRAAQSQPPRRTQEEAAPALRRRRAALRHGVEPGAVHVPRQPAGARRHGWRRRPRAVLGLHVAGEVAVGAVARRRLEVLGVAQVADLVVDGLGVVGHPVAAHAGLLGGEAVEAVEAVEALAALRAGLAQALAAHQAVVAALVSAGVRQTALLALVERHVAAGAVLERLDRAAELLQI